MSAVQGAGTWRILLLLALCGSLLWTSGAAAQQEVEQPYPDAPDPGGDPRLPINIPPPAGKLFGFHEATAETPLHGWDANQMAEVAAGAGANLHRYTIDWFNLEPERDEWDENWWARYRRLYDALLSRGIKPLITLAGAPSWAIEPLYAALCQEGPGCEYPPADSMDEEWAEVAAEVARRFPAAAAIEIWNEPNIQSFFKPYPNPHRYGELVALAYDAIKAANPAMTVVGGALAPTQTERVDLAGNRTEIPMKQFLNTAYETQPGLRGHVDGISFHHVDQTLEYGAGSLYAKIFDDARRVTRNHGDRGIDLWLTETGLTTQGTRALIPGLTDDGPVRAFTEEEQARGLLGQYRRLMQMNDLRGMIIHTLAERVEVPAFDFNRGYGVIRSWTPFAPKLAYCAFAGRLDTPTLFGGCPRIVDPLPPGLRCSARLAKLRERIASSRGAARRAALRKYKRVQRSCVPCKRKVARAKRKLRNADDAATKRERRARYRQLKRRCAPCTRKLRALEAMAIRAGANQRLILLSRHDGVRRRCTGRR